VVSVSSVVGSGESATVVVKVAAGEGDGVSVVVSSAGWGEGSAAVVVVVSSAAGEGDRVAVGSTTTSKGEDDGSTSANAGHGYTAGKGRCQHTSCFMQDGVSIISFEAMPRLLLCTARQILLAGMCMYCLP
jgi:hypothetical protein